MSSVTTTGRISAWSLSSSTPTFAVSAKCAPSSPSGSGTKSITRNTAGTRRQSDGHLRIPVRRSPGKARRVREVRYGHRQGHLAEVHRRPGGPHLQEHAGRIVPAAVGPGGPGEPRGAREDPLGCRLPEGQAHLPQPGHTRHRLAARPGERQEEIVPIGWSVSYGHRKRAPG